MLRWLRRKPRTLPVDLPETEAHQAAEHLLSMDEAIEAIAELRGLEQFRAVRELPHGFEDHWTRALTAYDNYVAVCLTSGAAGRPMQTSCGRACAGCCQRPPQGVHAVELLYIYSRAPDAVRTRFDFSRPCAFLNAEGNCTIYPARPLSCRMHFSRSDPELCWPGHRRSRRAHTFDLALPESIEAALGQIAARMGLETLNRELGHGLTQLRDDVLGGHPLTEASALHRNPRRVRDS